MHIRDTLGKLLGVAPPRAPDDHHPELLGSLLVMAWMVEARDPYTGGQSSTPVSTSCRSGSPAFI
ncbi:hypothetical protein [Aromatoleum anaerobium]|uniref:hypothetical protein n=1 Tax=Aromatoleum anaerobium TaxID=182180 RepID=UPI00145E3A1B|nr:hypothetical protein [Aromatoleum anaerobium]MCK0507683.1 hypothetical protein [Aromatoleum anaerobium]